MTWQLPVLSGELEVIVVKEINAVWLRSPDLFIKSKKSYSTIELQYNNQSNWNMQNEKN